MVWSFCRPSNQKPAEQWTKDKKRQTSSPPLRYRKGRYRGLKMAEWRGVRPVPNPHKGDLMKPNIRKTSARLSPKKGESRNEFSDVLETIINFERLIVPMGSRRKCRKFAAQHWMFSLSFCLGNLIEYRSD